jgi:crossover junction endodeoxyribonuclease RusA
VASQGESVAAAPGTGVRPVRRNQRPAVGPHGRLASSRRPPASNPPRPATAHVEITLPYPPTVNTYYRNVRGRTLISRAGRLYREAVCSRMAILGRPFIEGPLQVHAWVYPPDRRRRDLDNVLKAMLDGLQHAQLFEDDSQIAKLCIERRPVVLGGCVIVGVRTYEEPEVDRNG